MARSVYYYTDSRELGGAEEALLLLIEQLDRERWCPTVLYHASPAIVSLVERASRLGALVQPVPPLPLGLKGARRMVPFARELHRAKPAVFHAHLSWPLAAKYALAAAVLARVPAVVATVQLFPEFHLDRSNRIQERLLAAGVGRYVAVSHALAAQLGDVLRWPRRKIEVIHNGIDVERLQRPRNGALRRELAGADDGFVFLTAARLDPQKALGDLILAARDVPQARFVLAGDGPERPRLHAEAERRGVGERVRFLGYRTDVPDLLAASDAFVLPSLYEGSSLALLEAMAAGKPVVTTSVAGNDELVVDDVSGLLVPPSDPTALAGALRRMVSEPETRRRLATAARSRVESRFSTAATAARVVRVYEELLSARTQS